MADKHVISFTMVADFFKDAINQLQRGENAYRSGNVRSMIFDREVRPAVLKGTVSASMKKRTYSVEVSINTEDEIILEVSCMCPRGLVKCHHIAALLIHAHHNISVTDQACAWAVRSKSSEEEVKTIGAFHPKRKEYSALSGEVGDANIEQFLSKLGPGNVVGFTWLLRPESQDDIENVIPSIENLIFSKEYSEAADQKQFLIEKCRLTQATICDVRDKTVGQTKNENWLIARKNRLTASNFGAVLAAIKRQRYPPSLFKRLLDGYDLSSALAVQWGKEHENVAVELFVAAFDNVEYVVPTGLWLDESGFLGASPDGLSGDRAIIEVKCPYKFRNCSLSEALRHDKTYVIYKEGDQTLINYSHHYYHQIQGQLYLTNRDNCYLIVWTPNECEVVNIFKDEKWVGNLDKLRSFYLNQFVPFMIGVNK